jgi:zinc transporter
MTATAEVMRQAEAGEISDPGDLVAAYARTISLELDPQVAELGDTLDDIESGLEESKHLYRFRRTITKVRTDAIAFRRFVAPDRDALTALANMDFAWLSQDDRQHINEAANKFARMAEELEAVRERAALLHEQITDLRAEQLDTRGLQLSVTAFIFLPLTFLTGLLGMNVAGIPYAEEPWAFGAVVAICLAIALIISAYFIWRHRVHERR